MRILIVDDDDIALELLGDTLRDAGYDVESAVNGREALAALRRSAARIVISDWDMPEMNGVELSRQIRASDGRGYVYVMLLTSHESPQKVVEGMSAGADDFISKPFHPAELLARVQAGERVLSLETRDLAIFALAKLAESRDPDTGAHLERVRSFSRVLARQLAKRPEFADEVDENYIHLIYLTSPLHDIGKVGVPDHVLLKPGRLTPDEFEIMKTHTTLGAETLEAAVREYPGAKFLQLARNIAATHHEWFDGSGYPAKLRGDQIPLCGRIVALADVYDALTSKRVYKEAFSHEAACDIIIRESGTHFDPHVVAAFLECQQHFISIRATFGEPTASSTCVETGGGTDAPESSTDRDPVVAVPAAIECS
jgi:putative two-component system response regulator